LYPLSLACSLSLSLSPSLSLSLYLSLKCLYHGILIISQYISSYYYNQEMSRQSSTL
jgi:hypothetical protein